MQQNDENERGWGVCGTMVGSGMGKGRIKFKRRENSREIKYFCTGKGTRSVEKVFGPWKGGLATLESGSVANTKHLARGHKPRYATWYFLLCTISGPLPHTDPTQEHQPLLIIRRRISAQARPRPRSRESRISDRTLSLGRS